MSSSNCCFLTCIQISQEADQVVWSSHLYAYIHDSFILQLGTCTTICVTYFFHLPTCLPSVNYLLVLCINDFSILLCFSISSVQCSRSVKSDSFWPHRLQQSITNSQSLLKLMSIESVMLSNHLILCHPSPHAFNFSQHQGIFQRVSSSHHVAKVLEFQLQHHTFQRIFRTDFL